MELMFAAFNGTIAILMLLIAIFYSTILKQASIPVAQIWFFGTLVVIGGLSIYHLYWFLVFAFNCCNQIFLYYRLLLYEPHVLYLVGIIVPLGFAVHTTLFMREIGLNVSLSGIVLAMAAFTIFWAGMLHFGFPELDTVNKNDILRHFAVGFHVTIGVLSAVVAGIYSLAHTRTMSDDVKTIAAGFTYISGGFFLYQVHWAIHIFYLGFSYDRPTQWLLDQWWYLGLIGGSMVLGSTMLLSQCTKTHEWKHAGRVTIVGLSVLIYSALYFGLLNLKN